MIAKNNPSPMLNPQSDHVLTPNLQSNHLLYTVTIEFSQPGQEQCIYSNIPHLFWNCRNPK